MSEEEGQPDIDEERKEQIIMSTVGMPQFCKYMTIAIERGYFRYYTDNIDEKGETDIIDIIKRVPKPDRLPIRFCPFCGEKVTNLVEPGDKCEDLWEKRKDEEGIQDPDPSDYDEMEYGDEVGEEDIPIEDIEG